MITKTRLHTLDSLRGLASLQVLIGHCFVAIPSLSWIVYKQNEILVRDFKFHLAYSPLHLFFNATPAVKVFFVLSGFVLSLPYYKTLDKKINYAQFFVRRIFRLYLPCLAIVFISLILRVTLYKPGVVDDFGEWVNIVWKIDLTKYVLYQILILNNYFEYFNSALWTLPIEIKLSLILPFSAFIIKRLTFIKSCLIVVIYVLIWHLLNKLGARSIFSEFVTLYYFSFFLFGSLMCKYKKEISNWVNGLSKSMYFFLIAFSIVAYTFNYTLWWLPSKSLSLLEREEDYISSFSAVLFIIIALSKRAKVFFCLKPLLFIGRISFSLYLIHMTLIVSLAYLLSPLFNPYIIVSLSFILSFPIAMLFYEYIEIPSMYFSKYISDWLGQAFLRV